MCNMFALQFYNVFDVKKILYRDEIAGEGEAVAEPAESVS